MRSAKVVLPSEMMDVLHSPYPRATQQDFRWASLDMLRDLYRKNFNDPKVQGAKLAMETAISRWSDEQVVEFLTRYFLEPPFSKDSQSKSSEERRQFLVAIYNYLFV